MGHAHHFLSRLDRITPEQVDFALALYREHELVQFVLTAAKLPDQAPRVAIAVDDSAESPHLVVTRDGKFVTCLGAGMSTGDLPILSRSGLEALQAKRNDIKERIAAATEGIRKRGDADKFVRSIYKAGPYLSREDFVALSGIQVILADRFMSSYYGAASRLNELNAILYKIERPKPVSFPLMQEFWETFWALGHLAILVFLDGKTMVERWEEKISFDVPPAWSCIRQGNVLLALRGAWLSAKTGKVHLREFKNYFEQARTPFRFTTAALSLGAIAARHSRLREEIRKAVESAVRPEDAGVSQASYDSVKTLVLEGIDQPEACVKEARRIGAKTYILWSQPNPVPVIKDPSLHYPTAADVPDELALALSIHNPDTYLNKVNAMVHMYRCLPWVARAEPAALFLPRRLADQLREPWEPSDCAKLMEPLRLLTRKASAARTWLDRQKTPRKAPCPCLSGKKYKHCCGKDEPVGEDEDGGENG